MAVEKAYLMITTGCNIGCRYCIVRKTGEHMKTDTMRKAVDLVLSSEGARKKIAIYGGEPLTRIPFVKKIVNYVRGKKSHCGKYVEMFIYTNGYLLDDSILKYFLKNQLKIVFSLDVVHVLKSAWSKKQKHLYRLPQRLVNARRTLDLLGPSGVCVAPVILPDETGFLLPVFTYLTESSGFSTVKILPGLVRYRWEKAELEKFSDELEKLKSFIIKNIAAGNYVYLDSVNEALSRTLTNYNEKSRQLSVLEFYPDGRFGLSPCEFEAQDNLENVNDIDSFILGDVGMIDNENELWEKCVTIQKQPRHSALFLFSLWSERFARELHETAKIDMRTARYIEKAANLSFA